MTRITIYYEDYKVQGVNVTYDLNGERIYDYFSSMYKFNCWVNYEMAGSATVEITDTNYADLSQRGLI